MYRLHTSITRTSKNNNRGNKSSIITLKQIPITKRLKQQTQSIRKAIGFQQEGPERGLFSRKSTREDQKGALHLKKSYSIGLRNW